MPNVRQLFEANYDLSDGRQLMVRIEVVEQRGGSYDPAERSEEVYYILDGEPVDREELPSEITAEVIAQLIDSADPIRT